MSNDNQQLMRVDEPQGESNVVKAPITSAQAKIDAVANLTMKAYERASTLTITPEETAALEADFPDDAFQPGAAGKEHLIYIEHAHLRQRLNKVFGPGQWAIVPRNRWAEDFSTGKGTEASRVYVEAMLCVRGCFVAEAVGDMVYYKNNDSQNYGDAVEGAKTAALRRCAKELGIGLQAWKKEFCEGWWTRRRSGKRGPEPTKTASNVPHAQTPPKPTAKPTAPAQATEEQRIRWIAELKRLGEPALQHCYESGWLLPPSGDFPGEPIELLDLRHVPATKNAAMAILKAIQARMDPAEAPQDDGDLGPQKGEPEHQDTQFDENGDEVETITGKLEAVSQKDGKSAKGKWVRYGLKIGDEWYGTFDKILGELALKDKGHAVRIQFRRGEKGNDLVSIERPAK